MSLIQDALEKALSPEPETPKPVIPVAEEPRLQTNQYYETAEKAIPEPKPVEKKKKAASSSGLRIPKWFLNFRLIFFFTGVVVLSMGIGRLLIPKTSVENQPMPSPSAVVKTQTPITQKTIAKIKFTLTGITQADGILLALINNQVVGEGDRLRENATVKSISQSSVSLEYDGRPVTLTL